MTYKEYVNGYLGKFGLSEADIEFILFEADLDPDSTVTTPEQKLLLKTAIYYQLPAYLFGFQNVSEGGYSISWNLEGLRYWFSWLAAQLGLEDVLNPSPKVRDASNRW